MLLKKYDECEKKREFRNEMLEERRRLKDKYGENTRRTRTIIKELKKESTNAKAEMREKYREKIEHLRRKFDKGMKIKKIPPEIEKYNKAKVFDEEEYKMMVGEEIEITIVGDIELSESERQILKRHPKFAILENLDMDELELDMELGYAKYKS